MFDAAELKTQALNLGFDLVGICPLIRPPHFDDYQEWISDGKNGTMEYLVRHLELKESPQSLLPEGKSIVVVGLNYNQPNPIRDGRPRIARYALGRDYHRVIRSKLRKLSNWITSNFPDSAQRICVDSAPLMERDFAQLAGLGWFGKNTMIINSERGSWFFLGAILTSVTFAPDEPAIGGCGTCRACIDACPTGAILFDQDRWQVDARRCISYLTIEHKGPVANELIPKVGNWTFGCDVCQEVCPFNQKRETQPLRAQLTQERDFKVVREWPTLDELSQLSEEEWDVLTRGSATRRASLRQLRRNAEINLANGF